MIVAKLLRVRCTVQSCPRPADAVVAVERVADGVLSRPRLVCETCGGELQEAEQ